MENEILNVCGQNWLVIEAKSENDALNEIAQARVNGSVESKRFTVDEHGVMNSIIAHVHKVRSDGILH